MESDLVLFLILLCAGGIISNVIFSLIYKPIYRYLDSNFEFITYDDKSHPLGDNNILGKGWGTVINNLIPMSIWMIISFILPSLVLGKTEFLLGLRIFIPILIATFILYLRYDVFKTIYELNENKNCFNNNKPAYDVGYASFFTLVIMFCFAMFGIENFIKNPLMKYLILAIICLIAEFLLIFTDKINKYLPYKILTAEEHKKFSYILMMIIIGISFLISYKHP
ncbi:MAG: hypothetical protein E7Z85_03045 [Methanosphaera stadtmanae]|nr:hypothetical protein [Methanosphaera stadtmanae]